MLNINAIASCMGSCDRVKLDLAIAIGAQGTWQVHIMYKMRRGYVEIDRVKCYT